jgi:hemerythrin-like metal-binding protein
MSELFRFNPEQQSLQIHEMDRQHEILTALMNALTVRARAGASKAELSDLLKQLSEHTVLHFEAEEVYMEAMGYPKLDTHKLIHRDLLLRLGEHLRVFESGAGRLSHPLKSFLTYWLSTHINSVDVHDVRNASQRSA